VEIRLFIVHEVAQPIDELFDKVAPSVGIRFLHESCESSCGQDELKNAKTQAWQARSAI
jgi:hypothetical protein